MKTILVVEDEFDISEVVAAILRGDGYHVDVCENGREAIEYLERKPRPNLMILDVMLPFVSGLDVLKRVRSSPALKSMPVILMSSSPPRVRQSEYDWDGFLLKPFLLEQLMHLVLEHADASTAQVLMGNPPSGSARRRE